MNEQENKRDAPIVETQMTTSKDGRWFIHRTVITDIKSRRYVEKVLESSKNAAPAGEGAGRVVR